MVGCIFLLIFLVIPSSFAYGYNPSCFCPAVYDPVCGIDGKTYGNLCRLRCSRVPLAYKGPCRGKPCGACPAVYDPVCGIDGKTYGNLCLLICSGVPLAYKAPCEGRPCRSPCPFNYDPVCGVNGKTYNNLCLLTCSGVPLAYRGACRGQKYCPVDPCTYATCPGVPYATCRSCYCQARFYLFGIIDVTRLCNIRIPIGVEID